MKRTIFAILFCLALGGCQSAPQDMQQRLTSGGDRLGSTSTTTIVAQGHNTIQVFPAAASNATTQPSPSFEQRGTMTLTVTDTKVDTSPSTSGKTASSGGIGSGSQTSTPTNTPTVEVPITVSTPGSVGAIGK